METLCYFTILIQLHFVQFVYLLFLFLMDTIEILIICAALILLNSYILKFNKPNPLYYFSK